ncbi:hypothetical protein B0H63DRAFT_470565 [Podospora didyma]|uniref:Uncharacterized protein n=1 Tax=Podospora didyma TaxID=330526 RepID=A0AAE0NU26_9PEZI|nr:hypothetical protein B0H63DRAFT_470565 [Podospora didyma]
MREEDETAADLSPSFPYSPPSPLLSSPTSPPSQRNEATAEHQHEEGGRFAAPRPHTPPDQQILTQRRPHRQQHVRSPSLPLPSALSSPPSLHRLGIGSPSPLSPLLRQFSTPPQNGNTNFRSVGRDDADDELSEEDDRHSSGEDDIDEDSSDPEHGQDDDLAQDSKDVLIQRLSDLLQHLSTKGSTRGIQEAAILSGLHVKVDEMEEVMFAKGNAKSPRAQSKGRRRPRATRRRRMPSRPRGVPPLLSSSSIMSQSSLSSPLGPAVHTGGGANIPPVWSMPTPPTWLAGVGAGRFAELESLTQQPFLQAEAAMAEETSTSATTRPGSTAHTVTEKAKSSGVIAESVATEAEKLSADLEKVVKNLQARREESDHLHGLLVERAEAAAARIIELEKDVTDLEDEINSNESELTHLRLELRAVESMCQDTAAATAFDPDLVQSIENWKSDWALLRDSMSAQRKARHHRQHMRLGSDAEEESTLASTTDLGEFGTPS